MRPATSAIHRRLEHAPPELTVVETRQHRLLRRVLQGQNVIPVEAAFGCTLSGRGDFFRRHSAERRTVVNHDRGGVGGGEQTIAKLGRETRVLFVERPQRLLIGRAGAGAGTDEVAIAPIDETAGLRIQSQRLAGVVHGFDSLEELRVEIDGILMSGEPRGLFGVDASECRIGARFGDLVEDPGHPPQDRAGLLQRLDGVGKRRPIGIGGDRAHLVHLARHTFFERDLVVLVLDAIERRRLKRQRAWMKKWVDSWRWHRWNTSQELFEAHH